jgi:hypothetical protein
MTSRARFTESSPASMINLLTGAMRDEFSEQVLESNGKNQE